jgi:hypothetical protein
MQLSQVLDQKIAEAHNEVDKQEYIVMKSLHLGKFDDLLKSFGFDKTKIVQEVERVLGRKLLKPKQEQAPVPQKPAQVKQEFKPMTAESAADFFNQLGSKAATSNNNAEEEKKEEEAPVPKEAKLQMVTETISRNVNWDEGIEGVIKKNLLVGNLEYAAEIALKAGRTTEALLIADAGGEELFEKIKEEYFNNVSKDNYVKTCLKSIVNEDFKELINSASLMKNQNWKESLAYILSYVDNGT